jgi:hypothetical protein
VIRGARKEDRLLGCQGQEDTLDDGITKRKALLKQHPLTNSKVDASSTGSVFRIAE